MNENKIDTATRTAQIDAEIERLQNERFELKKEISPKLKNEVYEFISNATDFADIDLANHEAHLVNQDFDDEISHMIFAKRARYLEARESDIIYELIAESLETQCEHMKDVLSEELESMKESVSEILCESFTT